MAKQVVLNEKDANHILWMIKCLEDNKEVGTLHIKLANKIQKALNKKPIQVASRKAKGRELQKWAVQKIAELLNYKLPENKDVSHIRSREMGQKGVDVVLSVKARLKFPFAIECKNQEHISLPEFIRQAKANRTNDTWPILIVKNKALKEPLLIMEWDTFSHLYKGWGAKKDICLDTDNLGRWIL